MSEEKFYITIKPDIRPDTGYPAIPDIRSDIGYPAQIFAGYPAKSVSGATLFKSRFTVYQETE